MIAPTVPRRKGPRWNPVPASTGRIRRDSSHTHRWNSVAANRHGIVSRNHSIAAFPPSDCRPALREDSCALTRSFRFRIPQPPAPRGRTGSGLYARQGGPTQVGPFLFLSGCFRCLSHSGAHEVRATVRNCAPENPFLVSASGLIDSGLAPIGAHRDDERLIVLRPLRFSAATCTPRRASGQVVRGCRPGRRPQHHRRHHA